MTGWIDYDVYQIYIFSQRSSPSRSRPDLCVSETPLTWDPNLRPTGPESGSPCFTMFSGIEHKWVGFIFETRENYFCNVDFFRKKDIWMEWTNVGELSAHPDFTNKHTMLCVTWRPLSGPVYSTITVVMTLHFFSSSKMENHLIFCPGFPFYCSQWSGSR
jgi:hypothetical protein